MKTLNNEIDLGGAYHEWQMSKYQGGSNEYIRFGQYVFIEYGYEYRNSYNIPNEDDAYNLILKGLMENKGE